MAKVNKPTEDSIPTDPEQTPEQSNPNTEAILDDPPPEEHPITMEPMNIDPENAKRPSPAQPAQETKGIKVTSMAFTALGNPTILSKHSAKEEFSVVDKGKWKLDLESYAQFNAQELHAGYLNRLHTSRDFEAGFLNLMKDCFEVSKNLSHTNIYLSAAKSIEYEKLEYDVDFKYPC